MDTAVGAEETGPAAGHISCFILKGSIRNEEKEVISGLLLSFVFKMFIIKKYFPAVQRCKLYYEMFLFCCYLIMKMESLFLHNVNDLLLDLRPKLVSGFQCITAYSVKSSTALEHEWVVAKLTTWSDEPAYT